MGQYRSTIKNALEGGHDVNLTFVVDTTNCSECTKWFDTVLHPRLAGYAATGRSSFELHVSVLGVDVEVDGGQTIWPPEVADEATFDRLSATDRSMRFMHEGRDEEGALGAPAASAHVATQIAGIDDVIANYGDIGITTDAIGTHLVEAKDLVARDDMVRVQFNEVAAGESYGDWARRDMAEVTLSQIVRSGGFTIHDAPEPSPKGAMLWLRTLRERLIMWLVNWVEEHDDFAVKQKPY